MKKSEKIELRVNYAEKERLASIAERRGLTISDVVRGALSGELGQAPAKYPKWPGFVAIGALALSGLALMMNLNAPKTFSPKVIQTATVSIQYQHPTTNDFNQPMRTTIELYDGFSETYTFSAGDAEYRVSLLSELSGSETLQFATLICRIENTNCIDLLTPDFSVVLGQDLHQAPQVSSAAGPDGEILELTLLTRRVTKPKEVQPDRKS